MRLLGLEVLLVLLSVLWVPSLLSTILLPILWVTLLLLVASVLLTTVLVVATVLLAVLLVATVATVGLAGDESARARGERLRSWCEGGRVVEVHALRLLREAFLLLLPVVGHCDVGRRRDVSCGWVGRVATACV